MIQMCEDNAIQLCSSNLNRGGITNPTMGIITLNPVILGKRSRSSSTGSDPKRNKHSDDDSLSSSSDEDEEDLSIQTCVNRNNNKSVLLSSTDDDDDDIKYLGEISAREPSILEEVNKSFVKNPFYDGDESSRASSVEDSGDLDLMDSLNDLLGKESKIFLKKCKTNSDGYWNVKARRCDIRLTKEFSTTRRVSEFHTSEIPTDIGYLKDVELFDSLGNFQPVWAIEEKNDIYVKFKEEAKLTVLGPLDCYKKVYDTSSKRFAHYILGIENCQYKVTREDFSMKYRKFSSNNVIVNPVPVKMKVVEKFMTSKLERQSIDVENVLGCLGLTSEAIHKQLATLMPEEKFDERACWVAAFVKFCHDRMHRWKLKRLQLKDDGSDQIFLRRKFTNLARELDRGTQYLREQLLPLLLSSQNRAVTDLLPEVFFKSCVYRLMNKVETFKLFGGIPGPDMFSTFMEFIHGQLTAGKTVFTGVHQNMGLNRYEATITEIKDNLDKLANKIKLETTLKESFSVIKELPNFGDFFAWQVLCDLTEARVVTFKDLDNWACLGPGAVKGINLVFGKSLKPLEGTRKLVQILKKADNIWFELNIPKGIELNCKLVEHALCEFSKYCRFSSEPPPSKSYTSRSHLDQEKTCFVCKDRENTDAFTYCIFCNRKCHWKCDQKHAGEEYSDRLMFTCIDCQTINSL